MKKTLSKPFFARKVNIKKCLSKQGLQNNTFCITLFSYPSPSYTQNNCV